MRPRSALRGWFGAGKDGVFLGLKVESRHLARDAKRQPHVTIEVGFNGMRAVRSTRQLVVDSFSRLRIKSGRVLFSDVNDIGQPVVADLEIVNLPADLATPARPFLGSEYSFHQFTGVDALMHDLGYRDLVPSDEALAATARYLRDQPIERGSVTEMRLQDPFDYEAEDALIDRYRSSIAATAQLAAAYDPDFKDRYAPGSGDWRLVEPRS